MSRIFRGAFIKTHYCISELAALQLPRWPTSRQGWHLIVLRENWPFVEVKILGGREGVRYDYEPSKEVMLAIVANTDAGKALISDLMVEYVLEAVFCGAVLSGEK